MWGELRIIQGGHLKMRGDWEKFKYEGAHKISCGFEKIEGQGFQGACYRGVFECKTWRSGSKTFSSCAGARKIFWTPSKGVVRFAENAFPTF